MCQVWKKKKKHDQNNKNNDQNSTWCCPDSQVVLFVTPCWKVQSGLLSNRSHPDLTRRSRVGSGWLSTPQLPWGLSITYTPRKLWCMWYTRGVTRRSRLTSRVADTPQLQRGLCSVCHSWLPSTNHRPRKAWQSTLAKSPWVTPLGLGSLENKGLKSVGYLL